MKISTTITHIRFQIGIPSSASLSWIFSCHYKFMIIQLSSSPPATESNKGMPSLRKTSRAGAPGLEERVIQSSEFNPATTNPEQVDPSRCLLAKLGQCTTSRLIEVGHNNHPSRGNPGRRDMLALKGRNPTETSISRIPSSPSRDAPHGKRGGPKEGHREKEMCKKKT